MSISFGPHLNLLYDAPEGAEYVDEFRNFLLGMDNLVMASVLNSNLTSPPLSPGNGDAYLILSTPSGAWSSALVNDIAVFTTQTDIGPGWKFFTPKAGWQIYQELNPTFIGQPGYRTYDGTNWTAINAFPQPLTFSSGFNIGGQLLLSASGAGQVIATTTTTPLVDNNIVITSSSNFIDSGVLISQVANLTTANSFAAQQTFENGLTSDELVTVTAATPATSSANFAAPDVVLNSTYWNGTASANDEWIFNVTLGTGSNPDSTLEIAHTGSTGSAVFSVPGSLSTDTLTVNTFAHLLNPNAATPSDNFAAPELQFTGSYWTGTNGAHDNWQITQTLDSGPNPASTLAIVHTGSPGTAVVEVPNIALTNGEIVTTASNSGSITPPTDVEGYIKINFNGSDIVIPYYMP